MKQPPVALRILAVAALAQILATHRADAYIDPGSGSFFVQMLLAGLLGAGMAIKAYWGRLKTFFGGKKQDAPSENEPRDS